MEQETIQENEPEDRSRYYRELQQRIYDNRKIRVEIYTGCCDEVKDYCAERGVKAW